tara:strand:+ start:15423 stop:16184 length:762 start_codon:yes stop_codon:yes gene_type:complete
MVQIAEDYVSPSVRWGVLKQDYPEAIAEFSSCTGAEIGIPEKFGGVEEYCVAQILLRPTDEMPIIGYKPFSDAKQNKNDHASDAWNTLCTKALGRALKRAGYADTASEMKLVVTYKQRLAEHDAIRTGDDQTISEEPPIPDTETKRNSVDSSESSQVIADNFEPVAEPAVVVDEPSDEWESDGAMNVSHTELKTRVNALPEGYADRAREAHQKLNGRQWPIVSVSQFNAVLNIVEALHTEAEEEMLQLEEASD